MFPASKKHIVIGGLLAIAVLTAGAFLFFAQQPDAMLRIGGQAFDIEIADSAEERSQGLSGTQPLQPTEGMLFIFNTDDYHSFWMKDMNYSIDILWLNKDKSVVYLAENVSPDTYPESFVPDNVARYVLELPAGTANKHSIGVGAVADF